MANLSVTAQFVTPDSPSQTFQRFIDGQLLDLECERMQVGEPVLLSLPVGNAAETSLAGAPIILIGFVSAIKPGRSVQIVHHQPWRGRLSVRFSADPAGTRVSLESSLDGDGVAWLSSKRGYAPPEPLQANRHRVGLLVSKSGSAAVFARATELLAELAVSEVNADGGIAGEPLELLVGDDASDPAAGTAAAVRLMRSGCRAIFACVTSATFNAAAAALEGSDVWMIHSVLNEGGDEGKRIVRLGDRPLEQVRAGAPALMAETGSRRWFFVGHRYSWSYGAHQAARRVVEQHGGSIVGDVYTHLGTTDYAQTIDAIEKSGAELILSSLVGHDEVFFERQCASAGMRSHTKTLALVLDEATHQLIGGSDADGVWSAFGYFRGSESEPNGLEQRYLDSVAGHAPPLSAMSHTTYEAIIAYAHAAVTGSVDDRDKLRLRTLDPGHDSQITPVRRPILLAESQGGRLLPR